MDDEVLNIISEEKKENGTRLNVGPSNQNKVWKEADDQTAFGEDSPLRRIESFPVGLGVYRV